MHPTAIKRRGLTLLEVLLSIAIFGGALVAIGQLIRIGTLSAATARDLTEAQRHCNNVMAEVSAGILPPESASQAEVEGFPGWLYSIEVAPVEEQEGLLSVTVKVEQDSTQYSKPLSCKLIRWMTDPAAVEAAKAEQEAAAAGASSSSGTSGSTPTSGASTGSSPSGSGGSAPGGSGSVPSGSSTKTGGASGT